MRITSDALNQCIKSAEGMLTNLLTHSTLLGRLLTGLKGRIFEPKKRNFCRKSPPQNRGKH